MIRVVHPESGSCFCIHPGSQIPDPGSQIPDQGVQMVPDRIPDPGVKKAADPGSRIWIRNTGISACLLEISPGKGFRFSDDWASKVSNFWVFDTTVNFRESFHFSVFFDSFFHCRLLQRRGGGRWGLPSRERTTCPPAVLREGGGKRGPLPNERTTCPPAVLWGWPEE